MGIFFIAFLINALFVFRVGFWIDREILWKWDYLGLGGILAAAIVGSYFIVFLNMVRYYIQRVFLC